MIIYNIIINYYITSINFKINKILIDRILKIIIFTFYILKYMVEIYK